MFLKVITLPLLAVVGYAKVVPVPDVPYITPDQQSAIDAAASLGKAASAEGRQQLLELMQRPMFKTYLKQMADRPELINMKPEDVITNLGLQYQASEVVHNWNPLFQGDITINTTVPYKTFFQRWQLSSLGLSPNTSIPPNDFENWVQVSIFKLTNFTTTYPNFQQSSSRLIYGAMNVRKLSTGNPGFGSVCSVFKNSRIKKASTIFATDSGLYANSCAPDYIHHFMPSFLLNCSGFQPVGNFDFWEHTLLGNILIYNQTSSPYAQGAVPQSQYPEFNMAYMVATFLNEDYSKMPPIINRLSDFIEANFAANVQWDTDLKMIILKFRENLFGSETALTLRGWAISNDWVVVWANDDMPGFMSLETYKANQRFLDPFVLSQISAGRNSTSDKSFPDLVKTFDSLWEVVNQTLPKLAPNEVVDFYWSSWNTTWDAFKGTVLEVQPLSGTSCANNDCAVVRVIDKKCICEQ